MYKQPKPKLSPYKRIPCYGMFDTDDSGSKWQYLSDECYLYREVVIEGKPHFECETGEVLTRRQVSITKRISPYMNHLLKDALEVLGGF